MKERSVVLRAERDSQGSYHLSARLITEGSVVIEGHDLGSTPEQVWGSRSTNGCCHKARGCPRLIEALGGQPGDDPFQLLETRFAKNEHYGTRELLEEGAVPFEFWNRVGD